MGALDVLVERIYPMQYFETKQDGTKVCRNQKQEEMFNYKSQAEYENFNFNSAIDYDAGECENKFNKQLNQPSAPIVKQPAKRDVKQILKIRLKDALVNNQKGKVCKLDKKYTSVIRHYYIYSYNIMNFGQLSSAT